MGNKINNTPDDHDLWNGHLSPLGIAVSDLLERTATEDEWQRKIDIANKMSEERLSGCHSNLNSRTE